MAVAGPRGEWLNPLNRLIWQQAFKDNKPTVTLRDGTEFKISYDHKGRTGWVWVKPVKGFAPCGWFEYREVLAYSWVKES